MVASILEIDAVNEASVHWCIDSYLIAGTSCAASIRRGLARPCSACACHDNQTTLFWCISSADIVALDGQGQIGEAITADSAGVASAIEADIGT